MTRGPILALLTLGLVLLACAPVGPETGAGAGRMKAPAQSDLSRDVVRLRGESGPPKGPDGACWASSVTPAVIETTTVQKLVSPEKLDKVGNVLAPAVFSTQTQQRMIQDREEIWFRAPCPSEMTVSFVASLQRALKARGLYLAPVSGIYDYATAQAVLRFQQDRGLESQSLSLGAAKELGLTATALEDL